MSHTHLRRLARRDFGCAKKSASIPRFISCARQTAPPDYTRPGWRADDIRNLTARGSITNA